MPTDSQPLRFPEDRMSTFASVLDTLIPPSADGSLPGAGALGLAETLCEQASDLLPVLLPAFDELAAGLAERGAADFASLPAAEKRALLEELSVGQPAFLPGLLFQTYSHYYRHPRVQVALGLEGRPPYPQGYELEVGDLSLLDPVRARASIYRDS